MNKRMWNQLVLVAFQIFLSFRLGGSENGRAEFLWPCQLGDPLESWSGWWFGAMEFYDFPYIGNVMDYSGLMDFNGFFHINWECHHPNWRTPSFFRWVGIPPTSHWMTGFRIWLSWDAAVDNLWNEIHGDLVDVMGINQEVLGVAWI